MFAALEAYKNAFLALCFVALGGFAAVQSLRLNAARTEAESLRSKTVWLQASVDAQNAGITALKEAATKAHAAADAASKASAQALTKSAARAAAIEAAPAPKDCAAAIQFLVDDAKGQP